VLPVFGELFDARVSLTRGEAAHAVGA
jgi:hypothetical protein